MYEQQTHCSYADSRCQVMRFKKRRGPAHRADAQGQCRLERDRPPPLKFSYGGSAETLVEAETSDPRITCPVLYL